MLKIAKKILVVPYLFIIEKRKRRYGQYLPWYAKRRYLKMNQKDYVVELEKIYKQRTGHDLNIQEPKRFTEKIQWRKLNDNNSIYSELSDKYAVREWVKNKIGEEYLIPLLGVWNSFEQIDFEKLPNSFVLKMNNGSATNIVVKEKKHLDIRKARKKIKYWSTCPFQFLHGFEMQYASIQPKIIAEKYMKPDDDKEDLTDYKFWCFHGKPYLCQVISDRTQNETMDFYDMNWNHVDLKTNNRNNSETEQKVPYSFEEMKQLVEKLAKDFSYVRVDFYEIDKKPYFGEMTFTPAGGFSVFEPDEWDYRLGNMWNISEVQVKECD